MKWFTVGGRHGVGFESALISDSREISSPKVDYNKIIYDYE
jgi:hypothetical protein